MSPRAILAIAVVFFLLGLCALGGAGLVVFSRSSPSAPPPVVSPTLADPTAPPAPPAFTVTSTPPPMPTIVVPAAPGAPPAPPAPAPPAAPSGKPMRPELGMSLSDSTILSGPIELGPGSVGIGEHSPKIAGLVGGSPAGSAGLRPGDHVFAVDGHPIETVSQFELEMSKKTIPGEVVLKVGPTHMDSRDIRIVFK